MAHLQFSAYEGFGDRVLDTTHYSQAVRVGNTVEISGQGGWDRLTDVIPTEKAAEVDQVFDNVQHTLEKAGSKGWVEVYKVRAYLAPWDDDMAAEIVRNLKKYCPDHRPCLTAFGIGDKQLAINGMRLEVEVTANIKE